MNIGKILADKVNSKQQCLPDVNNLTTFEDVKKWFEEKENFRKKTKE